MYHYSKVENLINREQLNSIITENWNKEALEGEIMGWMPYKVRDFASFAMSHLTFVTPTALIPLA